MARPKKARQRRETESIAHTLDEIESTGDRLSQWISEHPAPILGAVLGITVVAAGYALITSTQDSALEAATAALGSAQSGYRQAMGASPGDAEVVEPANPETARTVREEYIARFGEIAEQHAGTAGAALAALEMGDLEETLGRSDEALETWLAAVQVLGPDAPLSALIELRIAAALEAAERWTEAGEAFERVAGIETYPLRAGARADAARCFAEAGETERALSAFSLAQADDPDGLRAKYPVLSSRLLELQAAQRLQ